MIAAQQEQSVWLLDPIAIVNASAETVTVLDTLGWDYATIEVRLAATDIALTVLKLNESDVKASATSLTSGTLVPGSDFSVSGTLPSATDDNKTFTWQVNLNGARKRYLLPLITVGSGSAGAFIVCVAKLTRGAVMPSTAAGRGYAQELIV